jgi:hypothetical protein
MIEMIAPVKKARYIAIIMLGYPSKRPIRNANFTSPNPIPFPFVTRYKNKRNVKATAPEIKQEIKEVLCVINK